AHQRIERTDERASFAAEIPGRAINPKRQTRQGACIMRKLATSVAVVLVFAVLTIGVAQSASKTTRLMGSTGVSPTYGSGWLEIAPTDFSAKDRLVLTIGGSASAVLVRLLPKGFDPNNADVTIAEKALVKSDRTIEITLNDDFKNIIQVSVHGKAMPFG